MLKKLSFGGKKSKQAKHVTITDERIVITETGAVLKKGGTGEPGPNQDSAKKGPKGRRQPGPTAGPTAEPFVFLPNESDDLIDANKRNNHGNGDNGDDGDDADDEYWHMEHFACATCETALAGSRYVVHDDRPHCIACFEQNHSNVCDECQKPIGINCKDLSYKQRHWHEQCFVCCECKKTLLQQPFGSKCDRIYCGDCYDQMYGTRCEKCAQIFRPGQRKLEYRGKQWHDQCFTCAKCIAPIGTRSFVPKNDEIYCSECYEAKFATRCVKCSEIILSNGVMFKNEPWHKACFTCNQCTSQLAGAAFLVRDDKAYCRDCFAERFSHKCSACCKPIIGTSQQSTRFISFEEDYWHIECFVCVDCKTRLEGRGFIRDGADIICGECAKIKLQAEIDA